MITPPLFRDFPTPEAMAASTPEIIFEYIKSVSYPEQQVQTPGGNGTDAGP